MKRPLPDRFFEKIKKTTTCWLWTGSKNTSGYGHIGDGTSKNKLLLTHRFSWQIHRGEIPIGMWVLHHCDIRHCVNPNHLYLGTIKENTRDMLERKRNRVPTGEDHYLTTLKTEEVKLIRKLYASGIKQKQLSGMFEVSLKNISDVVHRRSWKNVGE